MAFTINHIVLVGGNLTRDAELKYANNGNARLTFSVAMNRSYKDPNGQPKEVVEYFDIVYWGKIAEAVAPRLKKGQKVAIEGRLSQRRYTGTDGQQRNIVEISATSVILIGARGSDQGAHDGNYGPTEYEVEPSAGYSREPARSAPPQAGAWNQAPRPAQQSWAGNADYPPDDPGGPAFDNSPMEDNDVPF